MAKNKSLVEVEQIKEGARKPQTVRYRRASQNGRLVVFRQVDAESPEFTEQLTDAFRSNVRKARAENRDLPDTR